MLLPVYMSLWNFIWTLPPSFTFSLSRSTPLGISWKEIPVKYSAKFTLKRIFFSVNKRTPAVMFSYNLEKWYTWFWINIFRKTNISYPLIRTRKCAYLGLRNSFLENFGNVLYEWYLQYFVRWHVFINIWKENNASYTLLYVTHKTGASISPSIPLIAIIPGLTTCSLRRKKLFLSKLLMLDSA